MSENIKLQNVIMKEMIVKMRCYSIRIFFLSRMLYGSKIIYFFIPRYYNNTARVLACCLAHTLKATGKTVYFSV